jgi:hypothetical protein
LADLDNIGYVEFGSSGMEKPRKRAADAVVLLTNQDRLTLEVRAMDAELLKGFCDYAGELNVRRSDVAELRFHLYE